MSKLFHNKEQESNSELFKYWSFTKINYYFFGVGLALIIVGYIVMANGEVNSYQSLTIAPILLFLGYIVVIPLALIYRENPARDKNHLGS
tara:strand:- start:36 stop:305 length:270 start_codon:yes stop_codon:yes gene_type:complete